MVENKVLGIIFSNIHDQRLGDLSAHRTMGSVPIGGRYRFIDFPLSNFVNSGITTVGVITKSNYQSLIDHLGSGKEWDLSRKNGGLHILPPYGNSQNGIYRGRMEALANIEAYIKNSRAKYVVLSDCDVIANIDYADLVSVHRHADCDMTLLYQHRDVAAVDENNVLFDLDENGTVTDLRRCCRAEEGVNVCMNIAVMRKDYLEHLIEACKEKNLYSFRNDVLLNSVGKIKIHGYEFTGYLSQIHSMENYYKTSMELLDPAVRADLFNPKRPIYTKVRDESPATYGLGSSAKNTLIADGCILEGSTEKSILFRGVQVGHGSKVKGCIVMQGTNIGKDCELSHCIIDKDVVISAGTRLVGAEGCPVYVKKGTKI